MKNRIITTLAVVLGCSVVANAQLSFTFDSNSQGFANFVWSASGPAGWSGGAAIQAPSAVGGWTLGGSFNYYHEFDGISGQQPAMQALVATGQGHLGFDVILDGTSFPSDTGGVWYSIIVAGNSAGANGWTQNSDVTGAGAWHNEGDTALYSAHVDMTFTQLGWANPEDATGWFQVYFGANSDASHPVQFYIDNVTAYAVPEPSSLALAGLGALCLALRRRKA